MLIILFVSQEDHKRGLTGDPQVMSLMTWSRGAPKEASFRGAKKRGDGGNDAIDLCTSRHGGGEPDDWLPRACGWRPLPRWRVVVADWQQPAGEEEETFLWTHPFDPGRLAMMPAIMPRSEPGPRCVFQPAGQVPWFPVLGLGGKVRNWQRPWRHAGNSRAF